MLYFCTNLRANVRHTAPAPSRTPPKGQNDMAKKKRRKGGTLGTVTAGISTTMVLILLGLVVMFVTMAMNFGNAVRENFTVEVLLDDSISARDLVALKGDLQRLPCTRQVNYISKEQGTKEMLEDLDGSPEDFIGASPVPAEYEVLLKADYACGDSLARYTAGLTKRPYVKELVYPVELMDTMDHSIRVISLVLLVVAALLAFISFSLINNTVRMSIYAHRYSILTMKLVGAKWGFIRRPFMLRAMWVGLVSALVAGGLLVGAMCALMRLNVNSEFEVVTPLVAAATLGSVLACGLMLTLLCTYFSVNRHLRMTTDQVYLR